MSSTEVCVVVFVVRAGWTRPPHGVLLFIAVARACELKSPAPVHARAARRHSRVRLCRAHLCVVQAPAQPSGGPITAVFNILLALQNAVTSAARELGPAIEALPVRSCMPILGDLWWVCVWLCVFLRASACVVVFFVVSCFCVCA
jgi:hypothetical protein